MILAASDLHIDAATFIYAYLEGVTRPGNPAFAKVETLAKLAHVSESTGKRAFGQLTQPLGLVPQLIRVEKRPRPQTSLKHVIRTELPYVEVKRWTLQPVQEGRITVRHYRLFVLMAYKKHPEYGDVQASVAEIAEMIPGHYRGSTATPGTARELLADLVTAGLLERISRPGKECRYRPLGVVDKPGEGQEPLPLREPQPLPHPDPSKNRTTETHTTESQEPEQPAVGEVQVGRGRSAARPAAAGRTTSAPVVHLADIGSVIDALPELLRSQLGGRYPGRLVSTITTALRSQTAAQIGQRIAGRWSTHGYAEAAARGALTNPGAAAVALVQDCYTASCVNGAVTVDGAARPCGRCAKAAQAVAPPPAPVQPKRPALRDHRIAAGVGQVIAALPEQLRASWGELAPRRLQDRIAKQLEEHRTVDELVDRIGRRWVNHGYLDHVLRGRPFDHPVAVATALISASRCGDDRCEDGLITIDWSTGDTKPCELCVEKAAQVAVQRATGTDGTLGSTGGAPEPQGRTQGAADRPRETVSIVRKMAAEYAEIAARRDDPATIAARKAALAAVPKRRPRFR